MSKGCGCIVQEVIIRCGDDISDIITELQELNLCDECRKGVNVVEDEK